MPWKIVNSLWESHKHMTLIAKVGAHCLERRLFLCFCFLVILVKRFFRLFGTTNTIVQKMKSNGYKWVQNFISMKYEEIEIDLNDKYGTKLWFKMDKFWSKTESRLSYHFVNHDTRRRTSWTRIALNEIYLQIKTEYSYIERDSDRDRD